MPIFYRFRDITIHCSKIANILYSTCLTSPFSVTSPNLCTIFTALKSTNMVSFCRRASGSLLIHI